MGVLMMSMRRQAKKGGEHDGNGRWFPDVKCDMNEFPTFRDTFKLALIVCKYCIFATCAFVGFNQRELWAKKLFRYVEDLRESKIPCYISPAMILV